jgi:hypothetical protein
MTARARKKRLHPGVAVAMLAVALAVAGRAWFGGGAGAGTAPGAQQDDELPLDGGEALPESAGDAPARTSDLLAIHGSWPAGRAVRLAFSSRAADGGSAPAAAPAGEIMPSGTSLWQGTDPPALRLGVVMVSADARRAVLDGNVVGVGDVLGDVRIATIDRGAVTVEWGRRHLTYDLEDDAPREFRAERARRAARAAAAGAASKEKTR